MPPTNQAPRGLDLASYQGYPDWAAVAGAGIGFAITKATEGTSYTNPTFGYNWAGMRAHQIIRGAYHFGRPSVNGALAEADYFADHVLALGFETGDLAVLDLEDTDAGGDLGDWTLDWLERVTERLGVKPLLYTGAWYSGPHQLENYPLLSEYGLWLAAYQGTMPAPPTPWPVVAIWQYSDQGRVPGIAGNVDLDVYNGDLATLRAYGKPEPVPGHVDDDLAALRAQVQQLQDENAALISKLGYARGDVADALQAAVNTLRTVGA